MKFSRDDFKVCFTNEEYFVKRKAQSVMCRMTFRIKRPVGNFNAGWNALDGEYSVHGYAYCSKEDVFDENIGRKIARTKAENKAYLMAAKLVKKMVDEYSNLVLVGGAFNCKAEKVVVHNNEYIKKLENSVVPQKVAKKQQDNAVVKDEPKTRVKTYTKKTPFGNVTITEGRLTDEEMAAKVKEFEERMDDFMNKYFSGPFWNRF